MIYTSLNENGEIVFNEGFSFKSKEEAEKALNKVKNNEKGVGDYINNFFRWVLAAGFLPSVIINGTIIIPVSAILIQSLTTWLAFPGTAGDKLNKCNDIIKKCDRGIKKLEKSNNSDSKKVIAELEKVKKEAIEEKEKHEKRVKELGKSRSNFKENSYSEIFDNVEIV